MPSRVDARILVVDDDPDVLRAAQMLLRRHFTRVETSDDPAAVAPAAQAEAFDLLLLDMNFTPGADDGREGLALLADVLAIDPGAAVVMVTGHSDVGIAVEAIKRGATDFVAKPWSNERLVATLTAALALRRSRRELADLRGRQSAFAAASNPAASGLLGSSPAMTRLLAQIRRAAPTDANVLVLGENGTGKELVAREIHRHSRRAGEVFIRVDMGTLSPQLFESELFGHKRGAFTDARADRTGFFRAASGGTLFLDEIGNVPLPLQAKLLTALERREVVPVGSEKPEPIDIRLICATNAGQDRLNDETCFRSDLLYRINTVELVLPPLRDRPEDIPVLLEHYAAHHARKYNLAPKPIAPATIALLRDWHWPGNVRALRHAVERATILSDGDSLLPEDFPLARRQPAAPAEQGGPLDMLERAAVVQALERHGRNISRAAAELGLTRASLYRRIEKHGL